MSPDCKCCQSSNRERYEHERKDNRMSFPKLSKLATELGESISSQSFFRHFSPWHKVKEKKPVFVPPNKKTWGWADTSADSSEGSMKGIDELRD